ncbi:MAG TPA: hypothetical protein VGM64_00310 [Lacunisphaera sp.]|jgi:hypothetical protein
MSAHSYEVFFHAATSADTPYDSISVVSPAAPKRKQTSRKP